MKTNIDKSLGYLYFIDKSHPLAHRKTGRVYLHRHIMSEKLGRLVTRNEHVHHIDGDKLNNDLDNLELLSPSSHATLHNTERMQRVGKEVVKIKTQCVTCGSKLGIGNKSGVCATCSHINSRKVERPPLEVVKAVVKEIGYEAAGRKFGVTGNAVRKWIKSL